MSEDAYPRFVGTLVEEFVGWLDHYDNQPFYSLQEAYRRWFNDDGFGAVEGDYSMAVAVILVYLSRAVVNPNYRRYCCDPTNENNQFAVLQVTAPHEDDELTHWEFFTEANFRKMYEDWKSSRDPAH